MVDTVAGGSARRSSTVTSAVRPSTAQEAKLYLATALYESGHPLHQLVQDCTLAIRFSYSSIGANRYCLTDAVTEVKQAYDCGLYPFFPPFVGAILPQISLVMFPEVPCSALSFNSSCLRHSFRRVVTG